MSKNSISIRANNAVQIVELDAIILRAGEEIIASCKDNVWEFSHLEGTKMVVRNIPNDRFQAAIKRYAELGLITSKEVLQTKKDEKPKDTEASVETKKDESKGKNEKPKDKKNKK